MIKPIQLQPGITLRCCKDNRFKQALLNLQFVRPMCREEAGLNALLPAVLLRGCQSYPDLQHITRHLDDLYGAGMGTSLRRLGNYQTTGICCHFMEDRFALPGDQVFAPMVDFLRQMLRAPYTRQGVFSTDYVESEKKNLLAAIDSTKNDKRAYASNRLRELMCADDPFGVPRLGERSLVAQITAESLWAHYQKLLRESQVELFYVGSQEQSAVAEVLKPLFDGLQRDPVPLPPQTPLKPLKPDSVTETMEVSQGKLSMGFTTEVTNQHPLYAAMQVMMMLYSSSTGKLFNVVREKLSLCYDIGGSYYGVKGMATVSAGIDFDKQAQVRQEILNQLQLCMDGVFTETELQSAKQGLIFYLQSTHDSTGAIESYYSSAALSGAEMTVSEYIRKVQAVTAAQVQLAAKTLKLNTTFFLKGVD